jgi:hypothetical protein
LHRRCGSKEGGAAADLLSADYGLVAKNALYRCLDKLLAHKAAPFSHLRSSRWPAIFNRSHAASGLT